MPELPEVEVVLQLIRPHVMGTHIIKIEAFIDKLRYPIEVQYSPELLNVEVVDVRRYGRSIVFELANQYGFIIHLGMTGQIRIDSTGENRKKHDHVVFVLSSGKVLYFNCVRKFGYIKSCEFQSAGARPEQLNLLGAEPMSESFSADSLYNFCRTTKTSIKCLIMNNAVVTGIGNIYASESLFMANIHPKTPANRLSYDSVQKLVQSIKIVLQDSIELGLSYNAGIVLPLGTEWKYPVDFFVYGRNGEPCVSCSSPIEQIKISGRNSFYCPKCQQLSENL